MEAVESLGLKEHNLKFETSVALPATNDDYLQVVYQKLSG
jgi:hypothetical protein